MVPLPPGEGISYSRLLEICRLMASYFTTGLTIVGMAVHLWAFLIVAGMRSHIFWYIRGEKIWQVEPVEPSCSKQGGLWYYFFKQGDLNVMKNRNVMELYNRPYA